MEVKLCSNKAETRWCESVRKNGCINQQGVEIDDGWI